MFLWFMLQAPKRDPHYGKEDSETKKRVKKFQDMGR